MPPVCERLGHSFCGTSGRGSPEESHGLCYASQHQVSSHRQVRLGAYAGGGGVGWGDGWGGVGEEARGERGEEWG